MDRVNISIELNSQELRNDVNRLFCGSVNNDLTRNRIRNYIMDQLMAGDLSKLLTINVDVCNESKN